MLKGYPLISTGHTISTNKPSIVSPGKYQSDKPQKPIQIAHRSKVGTMSKVHKLLEEHGRQGALAFDLDHRVVDAAADFMADEEGGVGFIYSGFAQAALPHRKLKDDAVWQVQTEHVLLLVEPGRRPIRDAVPIPISVPYGSRARLIMLYLMT
jgi:hypothetical protein